MEDELHSRSSAKHEPSSHRQAVARAGPALKDPKRPRARSSSPPDGRGQTLAGQACGVHVRRRERAVQIDMSEYMEKHNVSR